VSEVDVIYWRCSDCQATPVEKPEPIQHEPSCPQVCIPKRVSDAEIVAAAREMAGLYRCFSSAPWYRAVLRLVVMCERPSAGPGDTRAAQSTAAALGDPENPRVDVMPGEGLEPPGAAGDTRDHGGLGRTDDGGRR
jgi:hypothetical protein